MKRSFWVVTGILIIVGGGTAFSQEEKIGRGSLTFNGRIASGVYFENNSATNKDGVFKILNMSYPDNPYNNSMRAELSTAYTNGNGGFNLGLRADDVVNRLAGSEGLFSVPYASGWIDLLDSKLRVTGGKVADNIWGTIGLLNSTITAAGLRLDVKPVDGLNAGVFFVVPSNTTAVMPSPTQTLQETIFGVRYANPVFWASALLQLDSDYDEAPLSSFEKDREIRAIAGAGFTGVPKLSVSVEADMWGLGALSDQGRVDLRQTVVYSFTDKLRVDFRAQELLWLYNDDVSPWLEFKPLLTYKVSPVISAVLEGGFGMGNYGEAELVEPAMGAVPNGAETVYQIYAKPTALLTLDGGLAVKTWYKFTLAEKKDQDSTTANQLALEFVWSF